MTQLGALVAVGVNGETLTSLGLVLLIHVAWADGVIQPEEKKAILKAA
ncbi:MAG: hypothetical protein R3C03_01815 [Pirellulaceae bacterium]